MSLRNEMFQLVRALDSANIPYALCGGLAMAVHGWPRATLDIDLLSAWESRIQTPTADGPVTVVSTDGLIRMKSLRKSGTDQDDIRRLKGESNENG